MAGEESYYDICVQYLGTQDKEPYVWVPELNILYSCEEILYTSWRKSCNLIASNSTEFDEAHSVSDLWEAGERAEIVIIKSFII